MCRLNENDVLENYGGAIQNSLETIFTNVQDDDEGGSSPITQHSTFLNPYDPDIEKFLEFNQDNFTVYSQNIDSLHAKHAELQIFVENLATKNMFFSCLCFQEARITEKTDTDPLKLDHYNLITRSQQVSKKGGLAIYLHSSYFHVERPNLYKKSKLWEALIIDVYGPSIETKLTIANIYRPPRFNNNLYTVQDFMNELKPCLTELRRENSYSIVAADFNINLLKLNSNEAVTHFFDAICEADFLPQITLPTRFAEKSCTLIDNILVNSPASEGMLDGTKINSHVFLKKLGNADHQACLMGIDIELKKVHPPKYIHIKKPVDNAMENIKNEVRQAQLETSTSLDQSPEENYAIIADTITTALNKNVPIVKKRFRRDRHSLKPWMTDSILSKIKEKDKLYNKVRKAKINSENHVTNKILLKGKIREINQEIMDAKRTYYARQIEKFKGDAKKTWGTIFEIMNKNRSKSRFPPFFEVENRKITDKKDIANEFNSFFSTIGQKLADEIDSNNLPPISSYLGNTPTSVFSFIHTTPDRVQKILQNMEPKLSSGVDGITSELLKHLTDDISYALSTAINSSIKSGIFPSKLKIARVIPLFKNKGKIWHFENWRPVSLLPAIFKIYEREFYNQIIEYFEANSLLCENQFGFRKNRSTEDAVLVFQDLAKDMLNKRQTPFAVFMDLSKAFDTIDHNILLEKLKFYGFSPDALKLMKSYLSDRRQYVDTGEGIISEVMSVWVGIPQGSILGPLCFLIYVNDLPRSTDLLKSVLFADDTNLLGSFSTFSTNTVIDIAKINAELDKIYKWLAANKLSLNVSKTKYMIFPNKLDPNPPPQEKLVINNIKLSLVTQFDFLGITIDSKLTWTPHTTKIAGKISKIIGVMKKIKRYAPPSVMKTLYQALVYTRLNYGIKVWGFAHQRVDTIQKKAIRIMDNKKINSHTDPIFKKHNLLKVEDIFKLSCLKLHYKIENNLVAPYLSSLLVRNWTVHQYATRNNEVRMVHPKFQTHKNCLRYFLPVLIRETPDNLLTQMFRFTISTFKSNLKKFYINQYPAVCMKHVCQPCGRLPY